MLFFWWCPGTEQGRNGHKPEHKFHTNMRKNFTSRVTEHWDRLPRAVVVSPLKIFKTLLDTFLCKLL